MSSSGQRLSFTPVELAGYLPSGWSVAAGSLARWDSASGTWSIDVSDGADNLWKLEVRSSDAANDRLAALGASVDRLYRTALGRASIWTG